MVIGGDDLMPCALIKMAFPVFVFPFLPPLMGILILGSKADDIRNADIA